MTRPRRMFRREPEEEPTFTGSRRPQPPTPPRVYPVPQGWISRAQRERI